MTASTICRLDGLEPDNLLAFMAMLGLLRSLEEVRPQWRPRVHWTVDDPPLRPALKVLASVDKDAITAAAAEGIATLAKFHDFGNRKNLEFSPKEAARRLQGSTVATDQGRYTTDLWAAMVSDAAVSRDEAKVEPTPLCFMFGQGHQNFLERLVDVPRLREPPARGKGRSKVEVSEADCLQEALFSSWKRPDKTASFRWDPNEDARYALRARNPSKDKETTQHGANRLAAVGISTWTVMPTVRRQRVRLTMLGGRQNASDSWAFRWPIWRAPISLAAIRALLSHPTLEKRETLASLEITEVRRARKVSAGRYMNVTRATSEIAI